MGGRRAEKRQVRAVGALKGAAAKALAKAAAKPSAGRYVLRLFVSGPSERSSRAIETIRRICEQQLHGRYELEVVDVYQQPMLAVQEQIVASPTLIKKLPLPLRRIIGDLSNESRVLMGLNLVGPAAAAG